MPNVGALILRIGLWGFLINILIVSYTAKPTHLPSRPGRDSSRPGPLSGLRSQACGVGGLGFYIGFWA